MDLNFIPFELSKKLANLGFNEFCYAKFSDNGEFKYVDVPVMNIEGFPICAPLWSQAFDWFLEKHNIEVHFYKYKNGLYFLSINNNYLVDNMDFKLKFEKMESKIKALEICIKKVNASK